MSAIQDGIAAGARGRRGGQTDSRVRHGRRPWPRLRCAPASSAFRLIRFRKMRSGRSARSTAYAAWRAQPAGLFWGFEDIHLDEARAICRKALAERGDTWLTEQETWDVLHAFAMPAAVRSLARTADEAAAFASVIGFPVAAKLASSEGAAQDRARRGAPEPDDAAGRSRGLCRHHRARNAGRRR